MLSLDPASTAFLLVDVNGCGYDDEPMDPAVPDFYRRQMEQWRPIVADRIVPAKAAAKAAGIPVIYVTNHLSPVLNAGNEWRNMSLRVHGVDVLTTWREPNQVLNYSHIIEPAEGEYEVKKQLYSGFFETKLDSLLRSLGVRNLIIVGFDSRVCVAATATDALYLNYRVVVLRDAVGTAIGPADLDPEMAAEAAIRHAEINIGYTSTSAEWIAACVRARGDAAAASPDAAKRGAT
jgi:ureidoacrylate peracid hydrolase